MISKFATVAVLAAAALMSTNPVHASHLGYKSSHIILGKAYFYSLNVFALITSLTGRDINDGTELKVDVKLLNTETACSNPQTHVLNPGKGPAGTVFLSSEDITANELVKSDRTKNTFSTTATGELVIGAPRLTTNLCKDSPGTSQWNQLFWKDLNCIKGQVSGNTCYAFFAAFSDGALTYITGPNSGQPVAEPPDVTCGTDPALCPSWTFVFLPNVFVMNAFVTTAGLEDQASNFYWSCQFKPNNEPGASQPGEPYSISNPPVNGWGGVGPAEYACTPITEDQYNAS